ncbi:Alpha-glucosidase [Exophiala dermatitidis]|uniref:Glucan 1,6-alpha-glucosidase n=1 Tax=Exophiala dermatitidis (strain ATCC 34100 / CBS 525.76 / NIH/UT8656) TaxID=858893 RepID=H6C984_EXODN|nr:glucan 1,6-alpha-glucosidase [Exophiala dermatitidis NIH/UT8656]EHY60661.1 glucan 1,6-alpha-glucosidase [Exophiala dermatitidis NIH/UT8656]
MSSPKPAWWKASTCYQIWPASYKDSNGDGLGDISGIISTLPYLKDLGVDTIWLSPMYDAPQKDMGYDISNYEAVYPAYGTLADMDRLIKECHDQGMRLILDLVVNHTSDQHMWFLESRKDRTNHYANWYIWRDPKIIDGQRHPPNNWRSIFGGSAWEYCSQRDQYYLHLFAREQPDLNWEHEATRRGIYKSAMEFWLDRGVDGFRVDTVNLYSKDISFPDATIQLPGEESQPAFQYFLNGPRMHEWLKEQREQVLDKYGDVLMVGELPDTEAAEVLRYVSAEARELSCVFDFDIVNLGTNKHGGAKKHHTTRHTLPEFKEAIRKVQDLIRGTDAWTTVFLENHDQGRSLSRFATDKPEFREQACKMLAVLMCCLTGTLFIYQGQEIGMYNHPGHWTAEELRDIDSLNAYNDVAVRHNNDPLWLKKAMKGLQLVGRDNARLPVQWDSSPNAGFTTGKPWIRVHDDYEQVNVAAQLADPSSPLNFWKKMIRLRRDYADIMVFGEDFTVWDYFDQDVFTFTKTDVKAGQKILVFLSFSDELQPLHYPTGLEHVHKELLVSNVDKPGQYLSPWEARAYLIRECVLNGH